MSGLPPRVDRLFRLPWRSAARIRTEVDDEIAFHLDMRTEELVTEQGMDPDRARERAEREFGDVDGARRALRERDERLERRARRRRWVDELRQDTRFAWRTLAKRPGFAAVATGILALGIGASVAMFTVLNAVLLKPLPYPEPERLVRVSPGQSFSIVLADAIADGAPSLAASTGLARWSLTLTGAGDPAAIPAQVVDPGFFDVFGRVPMLGRPFRPGDRDPSRSGIVVLSHRLWQGRFGGDPDIIGRTIELEGYGHDTREVVGVMPAGFDAPLAPDPDAVDLWVPFNLPPGKTLASDSSWYVNDLVARLAPGATVERAAQEVRTTMASQRERWGNLLSQDAVRTAGAAGLLGSIVGDVGGTLWYLLGAVGLVLLLACVNLANLLLARAEGERRELAVRAALGAGRARLVRQQMTRGLLLAVAGGLAGVVLARAALALLRVGESSGLPRAAELAIDWRVAAFALGAAFFSALAFGLLPAFRATAGDLRDDLVGAGRSATGRSRSGHRLNRALVVAEVAFAVVLVTAAGLMLNSLRVLRSVDPGLDADDVLALHLVPPPNEYESRDRTLALYDEVTERLAALPGVDRVGAIHLLPFTDGNWAFPYLAEGHSPPTDGPLPSANFRVVTPGYFDAVDIPVLAGRDVAATDAPDGARVGLINEAFARELWPGEDPIGKEIRIFGNVPFRVVGVVGDVRQHALDRQARPEMYMPLAQWRVSSMVVMVEGRNVASLARAAREAVWAVATDVPIADVRPLAGVMAGSITRRSFFTRVLTFFGVLALVLGAVGVYGVMAYTMRARLPEFGVRLALGATPGVVRRGALKSGLAPVALGLAVGLVGALATSRLLSGLLYGIEPTDPATFAAVTVVLLLVGAAATYLPARHASRVDPVEVLKAD